MTWFKVDDKFHSHRKIVALGSDVGALALWTIAGSWSADQLTDGWIPRFMVPKLVPVSKTRAFRFAFALETVGLWDQDVRENEPGWQFHGWDERGRQPSSEQILADREANAVRQAEFRERQKAKRNAVSNAVSNGVRNEAPTRPDPSFALPTEVQQQRAGARERPAGAPVEAVPLIDELTAEGFVVTWDLQFVDWDRVRVAIERSGIPALIDHVRKRHTSARSPAYSARAWIQGWSSLPPLPAGARLAPVQASRPSTSDQRVADGMALVARIAAEDGVPIPDLFGPTIREITS